MNNRKIVVIQWNTLTAVKSIVDALPPNNDIVVFRKSDLQQIDGITAETIVMPETIDTSVKSKNYVIQYFKNNGYTGKLHILEDCIEICKDPTEFINDIENLMDVLDLNTYFGTITDGCNRVYTKYNPRVRMINDKPEWQKFGFTEIVFCSHANTQWLIFDLERCDDEELHFNDTFTIPMYWIIEYLARRRNTHPNSLNLMNQYITCASELDVYRNVTSNDDNIENIKDEDALFKSLNINYTPDNNIDMILERVAQKLNSKI